MTEEKIIIYTIDDEIIDLEWCFINGHKPPHGRKYRYKVDGDPYITEHHKRTGTQILESVGKNSGEYMLRQKVNGSWHTIEPNEEVDFTKPGIEKFKTIKNEHTEGESHYEAEKSFCRDFSLLEEDEEFLDGLGLSWETIETTQAQWVLIYDYPIPAGFNTTKAILAVRIPPNYPTSQLDMLYFYPFITRKDGIAIAAVQNNVKIRGLTFQRWSRHRTPSSRWRPGIDNLSTHVPLAEMWLNNEFIRKPSHEVPA